MSVVGVDEAGKGAVLGSMFVAAVLLEGNYGDELADSKKLSSDKRAEIARSLRDEAEFSVVEVPAETVDEYVSDVEGGMNSLVVEAHAEVLRKTKEAGDFDEALLDASDVSEERFERRVAEKSGVRRDDLTAEHGADDEFAAVSAASVVAKVERDAHVERLNERAESEIGSGYPGDSTTREFLRSYVDEKGELPGFARSSWSTSKEMLREEEQATVDEF